jgi:hypothetical protein
MLPSAAKHMLDLRTRRERELERRMAGATPWDRMAARAELLVADALTVGRLGVWAGRGGAAAGGGAATTLGAVAATGSGGRAEPMQHQLKQRQMRVVERRGGRRRMSASSTSAAVRSAANGNAATAATWRRSETTPGSMYLRCIWASG